MIEISRQCVISAPPNAVWAVLADFESISTWAGFVDHSSLMTDQTDGVGMARRIQIGRTTIVETVTNWEPGVTLSYAISGLPSVIKSVTNTWRLAGLGDSTMVLLTSQVDAGPRPPQRVIAKVVARKLAKSSDIMLAGLGHHITSKQAS